MKKLTINIPDVEFEKFGLIKEVFSLNEFLKIIEKEITLETITLATEPAEKYGKSDACAGQVSFQVRKMNIKRRIDRITTDVALLRLEKMLNEMAISTQTTTDVFKPLKKDISVEQMIKAQKYHGIDAEIFENITRELDIREPLDELLKAI